MELLISTLIVVLTIVKTSAAGIVAPNALFSNTDQSQFSSNENTDNGYLVRNKRAAYIVPNDYYANYYNDYYNNYYNRPISSQNVVNPPRPSADRFDGDDNDNDNIVVSQGTRYVYTPIFKYKSTQQKRHKLFVPNLFG